MNLWGFKLFSDVRNSVSLSAVVNVSISLNKSTAKRSILLLQEIFFECVAKRTITKSV